MFPYKAVFKLGPTLLASDTTTFAHATALRVGLVKDPFTPSDALVYGDVVLADFNGSTPKTPVPGTQPSANIPGTENFKITLSPPAGGWRWETVDLTNLPQTIYGFIVYSTTGPTLYASALLDEPVELNAADQAIVLPEVSLTFAQGMIS
jgi:hypothetical protein